MNGYRKVREIEFSREKDGYSVAHCLKRDRRVEQEIQIEPLKPWVPVIRVSDLVVARRRIV